MDTGALAEAMFHADGRIGWGVVPQPTRDRWLTYAARVVEWLDDAPEAAATPAALEPSAVEAALADHLYTCDQATDLCYATEPGDGQTWRVLAEYRAAHLTELLTSLEDQPEGGEGS